MQYTTLNELRLLEKINETNVSKITKTLNQNFEKGLISEELCENSFKELDSLIEKAGNHKYFKREGTPGNYKYYYTEEEYKQAKGEKVIGHTKSGKPIYKDPRHSDYDKYSSSEQEEVAKKITSLKKKDLKMSSSLLDDHREYKIEWNEHRTSNPTKTRVENLVNYKLHGERGAFIRDYFKDKGEKIHRGNGRGQGIRIGEDVIDYDRFSEEDVRKLKNAIEKE